MKVSAFLILPLDIANLLSPERALYEKLLYPAKIRLFEEDPRKVFALAALVHGEPKGLIAALIYPHSKEAHIVSFFVSPPFRRQGIGEKLMQKLLEILKASSISLFELKYNGWEEGAIPLEKILKKSGWQSPQVLTERYFFDQHSFHPAWFFSPYPLLPKDFSLFRWEDVLESDIEMAKTLERSVPAVAQYSPFDENLPPEKLNSVGLRHLGKLVGWMISHRVEPKTIRYSAFYILQEHRGRGVAIALLKEAIRRHLSNEIDAVGLMEINVCFSPPYWMKFIKKRLAPFAFRQDAVKLAHYLLSH